MKFTTCCELFQPQMEKLPSGHQRYPLLGLNLGYMYWVQIHSSEEIETYQYMQKKVVHVLMVMFFCFLGLKVRKGYPKSMAFSREVIF